MPPLPFSGFISSFSQTFVTVLKLWLTKRRSPSKKNVFGPVCLITRDVAVSDGREALADQALHRAQAG